MKIPPLFTRALLCCALVSPLSVSPLLATAGQFGFNYWPSNFPGGTTPKASSAILFDANWPTYKETVKRDLDVLASMGVGYVRVFFWNNDDTMVNTANNGHVDTTLLGQQTTNLAELLGFLHARKMQAVICFGNVLMNQRTGFTTGWWTNGWATRDAFFADSLTWLNAIVDACQTYDTANGGNNILFYDLQNEVRGDIAQSWCQDIYPYAAYMFDNSHAPAGRRGFSILGVATNAQTFHDYLGGTRALDYADGHSYPTGSNPDATAMVNTLRSVFPAPAIVCMNEFGAACTSASQEGTQVTAISDRVNAAMTLNLALFAHWTLWDNMNNPNHDTPTSNDQYYGLGYEPSLSTGLGADSPKDAYGWVTSTFSVITNADMETLNGTKPASWGFGAQAGVTATFVDNADGTSVTNARYGRLKVAKGTTGGGVWMTQANTTGLVKPAGATMFFANGFVRGAQISNVRFFINQFRSDGTQIGATIYGPSYNPSAWGWKNYLHATSDWYATLDTACYKLTIGWTATAAPTSTADALFDVDAVSGSFR